MLRERHRERVRDALVEAAFALFSSKGFEATTVDEITERAGVSRRTFFRYFPSKEAALFPDRERRLEAFRAALDDTAGEGPLEAVRSAMAQLAEDYLQLKDRVVRQQRIIQSSPAALVYDFERDKDWEKAVATRLGDRPGESAQVRQRARLAAGALLGACRVVLRDWYASDGRGDLMARGAEAVELVLEGLTKSLEQTPRRKAS